MTEDERDNLLRYRKNNSNSTVVKNKQRLMLKSNCSVCGNKKICLLQRGLVYLIV